MSDGIIETKSAKVGLKTRSSNPQLPATILTNGSSGLTTSATATETALNLRALFRLIADRMLVSSPPERRMPSAGERSTASSTRVLRRGAEGEGVLVRVSCGHDRIALPPIDFARTE